jgi:hypothetical protein
MGAAERYCWIADLARGEEDVFLCVANARVPVVVRRRVPMDEGAREHLAMTVDQARILSCFSHPNVERLIELGREGETYFLVMEFLAGQPLDAVMHRASERGVAIPFDAKVLLVAELLAGLQAAHEARDRHGALLELVHGDVNAKSVLITYDGEVKLTGFGRATAPGLDIAESAGLIDRQQPDRARDICAVGALLSELASTEARADSRVREIIDRACAPSRGYAGAAEMRQAVVSLLPHRGTLAEQLGMFISDLFVKEREEMRSLLEPYDLPMRLRLQLRARGSGQPRWPAAADPRVEIAREVQLHLSDPARWAAPVSSGVVALPALETSRRESYARVLNRQHARPLVDALQETRPKLRPMLADAPRSNVHLRAATVFTLVASLLAFSLLAYPNLALKAAASVRQLITRCRPGWVDAQVYRLRR